MAGRFINTSTTSTNILNSIANTVQSILDNPYYLFSDKKASLCTYYNLNTTRTTLDEASRTNYGIISKDSPLRFNKINNFYLYGVDKIEPQLEIGEYGLESADLVFDAIVLPKTIIPYPGDFFTLHQLKKNYLFEVTAVQTNMLDTGAVMYRINYKLSSSDGARNIEPQVVRIFNFSVENLGSNFGCLIDDAVYQDAGDMEAYATTLKDYYIQLFFDSKVQTFTYMKDPFMESHCHCGEHFGLKVYDPYLVEFIIRNKILSGSTQYIVPMQQMYLHPTFGIDYDRTILRSLELNDIENHIGVYTGNIYLCDQKLSLLYAYPEDYYYTSYRHLNGAFCITDMFEDPGFGDKIKNNEKTDNILKNIVIKYFNGEEITNDDLKELKHIDYYNSALLYYTIPMVIFCIENQIQNMLNSNANNNSTEVQDGQN